MHFLSAARLGSPFLSLRKIKRDSASHALGQGRGRGAKTPLSREFVASGSFVAGRSRMIPDLLDGNNSRWDRILLDIAAFSPSFRTFSKLVRTQRPSSARWLLPRPCPLPLPAPTAFSLHREGECFLCGNGITFCFLSSCGGYFGLPTADFSPLPVVRFSRHCIFFFI